MVEVGSRFRSLNSGLIYSVTNVDFSSVGCYELTCEHCLVKIFCDSVDIESDFEEVFDSPLPEFETRTGALMQ